jgi:hypothetical protein
MTEYMGQLWMEVGLLLDHGRVKVYPTLNGSPRRYQFDKLKRKLTPFWIAVVNQQHVHIS